MSPTQLSGSYVTTFEAALASGRPERTIRGACKAGRIPGAVALRISARFSVWLMPLHSFQMWLANPPPRGRPPTDK